MGARGRGVKKFLNRQANVGLAKFGHSPPLRQEATGACFSLEAVNLYPGVHVRGLRPGGRAPTLCTMPGLRLPRATPTTPRRVVPRRVLNSSSGTAPTGA